MSNSSPHGLSVSLSQSVFFYYSVYITASTSCWRTALNDEKTCGDWVRVELFHDSAVAVGLCAALLPIKQTFDSRPFLSLIVF